MKQEPLESKKVRQGDGNERNTVSTQTHRSCSNGFCISSENLSSYADGEYELSKEEKNHLLHCPCCQKELAFLQKMDHALHTVLQQECPEELTEIMSERLKAHIRKECREEQKKKFFFSFKRTFFHAAASLLLFSLIAYLLMDDPNLQESAEPEKIPSANKDIAAKIPAEKQEKDPFTFLPPANIDIRNLVAASSGNTPVKFLSSPAVQGMGKPALIQSEVKLLWLYNKAKYKNPASELEKLLAEKVPAGSIKKVKQKKKTNLVFIVTTTRRDAVSLVRHLAAKKLLLLSPDQPQPEQQLFYGSGKEKTRMIISFLPQKTTVYP